MNRRQLLFGAAAAAVAPAAVPVVDRWYHSGAGEYLHGIEHLGGYTNIPGFSADYHIYENEADFDPDADHALGRSFAPVFETREYHGPKHFIASPVAASSYIINAQGWMILPGVFGIADK